MQQQHWSQDVSVLTYFFLANDCSLDDIMEITDIIEI